MWITDLLMTDLSLDRLRRRLPVRPEWLKEFLDIAHFALIVNGAILVVAYFMVPTAFDFLDPIQGPNLKTFALQLIAVSLPVCCVIFGVWRCSVIQFITLRRRSKNLLDAIAQTPASAWRRIELENTARAYKTPRVLDQRITLNDYDGLLRQLTVADLGHEQPTLLLTNQLRRSATHLIGRHAQRMLIENNIEDGIDFFHMDALSSAVAMKVNCDLQLTLMASSLYRLLAVRIGNGYEVAKSRHRFRDFIDATAEVSITGGEIVVQFQKRAHNPLLIAAGFDKTESGVPWLGDKRLRLVFG